MKTYLLSVVQPDGPIPPAAELEKIMQDLDALNEEMRAAGAWVFSAGLHAPSTATLLRPEGGDVLMTDGPFAEGKEHIGGLSIIRAEDLDGISGHLHSTLILIYIELLETKIRIAHSTLFPRSPCTGTC